MLFRSGSQALAYARVRKAAGESDFTRAARQQEVLIALRDAIVRGGFINDPIGFIEAIGRTVSTSVPPELVASLAVYATRIRLQDVYRAVITYPLISTSAARRCSFSMVASRARPNSRVCANASR